MRTETDPKWMRRCRGDARKPGALCTGLADEHCTISAIAARLSFSDGCRNHGTFLQIRTDNDFLITIRN